MLSHIPERALRGVRMDESGTQRKVGAMMMACEPITCRRLRLPGVT